MPSIEQLQEEGREYAWRKLLDRVERGEHPTRPEVATLVERHGVADDARGYVAAVIRDEAKLLGHRPKSEDWSGYRAAHRHKWVQIYREAFRLQGHKAPKTRALEVVAGREGIRARSVAEDIRRNLHDAPRWAPRVRDPGSSLARLLEEGSARLDPDEGLVWVEGAEGDE